MEIGGAAAVDLSQCPSMTVGIRPAHHRDREGILAVVDAAFTDTTRDGHEEVEIVRETWKRQAFPPGIELVADEGDAVVGHILAAVGDLGGTPTVGIAPLSVTPTRQRQGLGSALMTELLVQLHEDDWPIAVLLGDPGYYERFGFEPSARYQIAYQPVGMDNPHFMVRLLRPALGDLSGNFTYCWETPRA